MSFNIVKAQKIIHHLAESEHGLRTIPADSVLSLTELWHQQNPTPDSALFCYVQYKKAKTLISKSLFDSAATSLKKVRAMSQRLGIDTIKGRTELNLGIILTKKGNPDSALYYNTQAFNTYSDIGDSLGVARSLLNLAINNLKLGDYQNAIQNALKSNHLYQKFGDEYYYYRSLNTTANIFEKLNDYSKAMDLYTLCYEKLNYFGDKKNAAMVLGNMGVIYYRFNEFHQAQMSFEQAAAIHQALGNIRMALHFLSNLSIVYRESGQLSKAINTNKRAVFEAKEHGYADLETSTTINIGVCYKELNMPDSSQFYYLQALDLARQYGLLESQSNVLFNLVNASVEQNNYKEAYTYQTEYYRVQDSILNLKKQEKILELTAQYETQENKNRILELENVKATKELANQKLKLQRNVLLGSGFTLFIVLIISVFAYRIKLKKDRIIKDQKIKQLLDEKRLLAAGALLEGQEKERLRIARELHDGIGILLSTARIHFSNIPEDIPSQKTEIWADKASYLIDKAGSEIRKISHNMMPEVLQKFGLQAAVEDLLDEVNETGKVKIHYSMDIPENNLKENQKIMLFRVVQEMLNNTLKHAEAKHVSLKINVHKGQFVAEYNDDGNGYDPQETNLKNSIGLKGIFSRIDFLKGSLFDLSVAGKGAFYRFLVPLQ